MYIQIPTSQQHFQQSWALYFSIGVILLASGGTTSVGQTCLARVGFKPYTYKEYRAILPSNNKKLINHNIKAMQDVSSTWRCGILCLVHEKCISYNYDASSGMCELSDATADVYPCHLVDDNGFGYYQIIHAHKQESQEVAAECLPSQSNSDSITTTERAVTEGGTTASDGITTTVAPYNCSIPMEVSECNSFWIEENVDGVMSAQIPSTGDFKWSLTHLANGDDIIASNPPCADTLDVNPPDPESYVRFRMFHHHHIEDSVRPWYGFCLAYLNATYRIHQKCTEKTQFTSIPKSEFTLHGSEVRWTILADQSDGEYSRSMNYDFWYDSTGLNRYIVVGYFGLDAGEAWQMCRVW